MTDNEAFESWFSGEQGKPYDGMYAFAQAAFHAALAWLRSQGEPVAWIGQFDGLLYGEQVDADDTPLFLAPRAVEGDDREYLSAIALLGSAMRRLVIAARTSGGTAGPDEELMAACAQAEDAMTFGAIARAMLAPQPAIPDEWQPIETAPKDGVEVLLYIGSPWSRIEKARWYGPWENWQTGVIPSDPVREECHGIGSSLPTHWMPLPPEPTK